MVRVWGLNLYQWLVSCILFSGALQVKGEVILEPPLGANGDELVVDKGSTFTLTCRGESVLDWGYNEYEPNSGESRSQVDIRQKEDHGQFVTTLTVEDAYFLDTGYFYCYPRTVGRYSPLTKSIYVYVRDSENMLAVNDTLTVLPITQWNTIVLPCRPTDPSLEVVLMKDGEEVPDTKYDPRVGFSFMVETIHQSGVYECNIKDTDSFFFVNLHVNLRTFKDDIEKPHIDITPLPVVEGLNITFLCSVHYDIGVTIFINWSIPDPRLLESGRIEQHNATSINEKVGGKLKNHKGLLTMNLYDVGKDDEGDYTCHVIDGSGNQNNRTYRLEVLRSNVLQLRLRGQQEIKVSPAQNSVQLLVDINAHPPPKSTQWYDNNMKPIIGEQNPHTSYTVKTTPTESKLTIHYPDVRSSGIYTLVVNNDEFNKSINATLEVMGEPEVQVNQGTAVSFYLINQEHQIDCEVFALPKPNITWYFNPCGDYPQCSPVPQLVPPSQYSELEVNSLNMPLKSTVRVYGNQTGQITCKACNILQCNSEPMTFLVTDVSDGFSVEGPKMVVETDNVTLSCGASKYNYTSNLQWFYRGNDGQLSPVKDLETWTEETEYSYFIKLNFPNVVREQTGQYVCTVYYRFRKNVIEEKKYFMNVKKLEKPIIHRKNISTKWSGQTGRRVQWHCRVHGTPPPIIIWYKNNMELSSVKKLNLELRDQNQTLVIQVGLEDEATYSCVAVNKAGQDTLIFEIELTDKPNIFLYACLVGLIIIICAPLAAYYLRRQCKLKKEIKELTKAGLLNFEKGNIECLNPELDVGEQAELLPYDREKWEFPRDKLKLGKQLGSGAFGMVLRAEAYELMEPGVATVVAVKMVKRNSDVQTIKALASELKIMTHLGKHLNVVNVLGACTGDLNKRELLVLVEYCQYGNLRDYLLKHRGAFINQVNPRTGMFDPTVIQPSSPRSPSARFSDAPFGNDYSNGKVSMRTSAALSHVTDTTLVMSDMSEQAVPGPDVSVQSTPIGEDGYLICKDHEWRNTDRGDYKDGLKPICTQDLICWGFQIARGMEYLASRKVLHGDLAARNVLLADENIVKICDFGFSKSMYRDSSYHKKGDGPLPVKWLALESIRDRVFSTQSDVWAYGVTIWEMFSLAQTPYPGMEVDEKLFSRLADGYRMEQPKFATKQVYKVMIDCWHINPHTRPSFTELAERMGGMLEDTVRTHYVDLNDPFLQENVQFLAQRDYLGMLRSPSYENWTPAVDGYTSMKPALKDVDEAMELTPMLDKSAAETISDSPDGSPTITKPLGNNYVNVAQVLGFSNPSYHNLGRPKQSPYVNMQDSSEES